MDHIQRLQVAYGVPNEHVLVAGDFNCHTGWLSLGRVGGSGDDDDDDDASLGGWMCHARQSRDTCLATYRGDALQRACLTHEFLALNGRCPSDLRGEATFVRGHARTVIDYALVPRGARADMRVQQPRRDSDRDHRALLVSITPTLVGHPLPDLSVTAGDGGGDTCVGTTGDVGVRGLLLLAGLGGRKLWGSCHSFAHVW